MDIKFKIPKLSFFDSFEENSASKFRLRIPTYADLLPYSLLFALLPIFVTWVGLAAGGYFLATGFVFSLILSNADEFLGNAEELPQLHLKMPFLFYFFTPAICGIFLYALHLSSLETTSFGEIVIIALSIGTTLPATVASVSHELLHRPKVIDRMAYSMSMIWILMAQHQISHLKTHHVIGGNGNDSESSRKGETIYEFLPRAVVSMWKEAYRGDRQKTVIIAAIQLLLIVGIIFVFGFKGLLFFVLQAIMALLIVGSGVYMSHYGLTRREIAPGVLEPFKHHHAWDSYAKAENLFLVNFGRHSDHHLRPQVDPLEHVTVNKRLVFKRSHLALITVPYLPSVWFSKIHPQLAELEKLNDAASVNLTTPMNQETEPKQQPSLEVDRSAELSIL